MAAGSVYRGWSSGSLKHCCHTLLEGSLLPPLAHFSSFSPSFGKPPPKGRIKPIEFVGPLHYCNKMVEIDKFLDKMLDRDVTAVGFDCEWREGRKQTLLDQPLSVVEMCFKTQRYNGQFVYEAVLFHVKFTGITNKLKDFLEGTEVVKAGISLYPEKVKLRDHHNVTLGNTFDMAPICFRYLNKKERYLGRDDSHDFLARKILKRGVRQFKDIGESTWARPPLSYKERDYAALKTFVCLRLYERMLEENAVFDSESDDDPKQV